MEKLWFIRYFLIAAAIKNTLEVTHLTLEVSYRTLEVTYLTLEVSRLTLEVTHST